VIRLAKRYHPRVRNVAIYALETTILNLNKGKNVLMRHKSLLVEASYLFQAFSYMHSTIEELVIAISAMIESNQCAILVSNFGLIFSKIRKEQALSQINNLAKIAQSTSMIEVSFVDVFTSKAHAKPNMSYLVQSLKKENNKANILNHWEEKYKARVQAIIDRHQNLFRAKLGKFNDDVEMPMPFVDENNVTGLKQASYSLIARDRKAIDEILDSLMR